MKVKVKICGIRSYESAITAINNGADFLGFNFVPTSKRFIEPERAEEIIKRIHGVIKIVGIFKNSPVSYINNLVERLNLDLVQLHGEETGRNAHKIHAKVIKAFHLKQNVKIQHVFSHMKKFDVHYFLLDREKQSAGPMIDLRIARRIAQDYVLFFAGGLTVENVKDVIKKVEPYAVDVATGIETNGVEDLEKIKLFIKNAKGVQI